MRDVDGSIAALRGIWDSGPGMHKTADDLNRYERVIAEVRPEVVVETGLYYGGSQLWFAQRVPWVVNVEINPHDVRDYLTDKNGLGRPPTNGIVVRGDSCAMFSKVAELACDRARGRPIMVVLDSNHDTETVYRELTAYHRLVTVGSYLVVEDTILHNLPAGKFKEGNWFNGDPLLAVERWLPGHPEFVADLELEDWLPTTQHPGGWLRRVA